MEQRRERGVARRWAWTREVGCADGDDAGRGERREGGVGRERGWTRLENGSLEGYGERLMGAIV